MSEHEVVAVIQARMGSTRLPGKVLRQLVGKPVLQHVIDRARAAACIDRIVVATTALAEDDPIASCAARAAVGVTRGSVHDVLDRYAQAFREHGGGIGVRITSDCPCLDPVLLARAVQEFRQSDGAIDYLSNAEVRSYPRGYDIEVFRVDALHIAAAEATDPSSREHVTPFLYRNTARFRTATLTRPDPLGTASWRLTLDTEQDWRVLEHLFEALTPRDPMFGLSDVEGYITRHPSVLDWNREVKQKVH
ncbi:MAG TPA: glycosyltransferase family protein [Gemmatimonadaceae bacterium]|nr:glycosyltransferase family protein [Gemmatimonadaceae bacterium]